MSGKVTYNGQPLPGGSIVLHAKEGKQTYTGTIRSDGTFTITDGGQGVMVVTIDNQFLKQNRPDSIPAGVDPKMLENMMPKDAGGRQYVPIPEKYSNAKTSPLTWEIKTSGESKDFDLND